MLVLIYICVCVHIHIYINIIFIYNHATFSHKFVYQHYKVKQLSFKAIYYKAKRWGFPNIFFWPSAIIDESFPFYMSHNFLIKRFFLLFTSGVDYRNVWYYSKHLEAIQKEEVCENNSTYLWLRLNTKIDKCKPESLYFLKTPPNFYY